jgi:phage protein D
MLEVELLLNEPPQAYRSPRLRLFVNGQALSGAYEVEIVSNNHFGADRFDAVVALGPDPWATAYFWSSQADIVVDIQLGLDGGTSFTSLIQGFVDKVSIDPVGGVVRLSGRDFTAALIGARTQETFSNRTSSEIAEIFAQRHSLTPCVVPTSTPVGRFYQSDHESVTLDRFSGATTEWDLLVYLARQESYDAFVAGSNLYFQPAAQTSTVNQVIYSTDMIELRLERMLTLAREIQVTVQSWNSLQQIAFTESVSGAISESSPNDLSPSASPIQHYIVVRPNLTPDRALTLAQQRMSELTRHERVIDFSMPGELMLTPRSTIMLDGTGTEFDQVYFIDSIERTFRPQTGFIQRVRASNSSPRTESTVSSTS